MPSAQVIDLNPSPRTELTPLEKTLSSFSARNRENQIQQRDSDALSNIYREFQQDGNNIQNAIQRMQTDPNLSPTTRVNSINQLMGYQKHNNELQKQAYKKMQDQKKQQQADQKAVEAQGIVRDLESRRGLNPNSLAAYDADPKMAEQISRVPKEPKATQASQPINEDQLRRIQHVENQPEYQSASPSRRAKMFRDAGVSKENTDAILKPLYEEEKLKPGAEYGKLREKAVGDYVNHALSERESADEVSYAISSAKKALEGDVQGPGAAAIIKSSPYGQLIMGLTPDEALLQSSNKKLLEGTKGLFGARPTEKEIFLLLNSMLPSIGRTKESNLASLYFIEKINDLKKTKGDIVEELTGSGNYVPDLESQVNKRMAPLVKDFKAELELGADAVNKVNSTQPKESEEELIRVEGPGGKKGRMTRKQLEEARANNVIFTPI